MIVIENETKLVVAPDLVWRVLTDFERYAAWHPVVRLEGKAELGSSLEYSFDKTVTHGFAASARARIVAVEAGRLLQWRLGVPLLLRMTETYSITAQGSGSVLIHRIEYRGLGAILTGKRFMARSQEMIRNADASLQKYVVRSAPLRATKSVRHKIPKNR